MDHIIEAKLFCLNAGSIETDIRRLQKEYDLNLGESHQQKDKDNRFYPLFPAEVRKNASRMAMHYEIFYCLEVFIRDLISERLNEEDPKGWWKNKIPEEIRKDAEKRREQERAEGVTPRSDDILAYTNFGELSQIIEKNWDLFGEHFSDNLKGLKKIMYKLNGLRAPIAHCGYLSDDEIIRLKLTMGDLFRLMA